MSAVLIALGGALGTLLRHGTNLAVSASFGAGVAAGTLVANLVGSFALGLMAETVGGRTLAGTPLNLIIGTGVLGGFTTYSTFNLVTLRLAEEGQLARAGGYMLATAVACLVAGLLGLMAGRALSAGS